MANKVIVVFVEGDSEEVFYSKLCKYLQTIKGTANKIIIKNLKGIGNYESKAYAKLKNEVIPKFKNASIIVFCSYDTDVFNIPFQQKPPVDWKKVESKISTLGYNIIHIKAEKSIEDWFLKDINGLCSFLGITVPKKIKGRNGFEKMKNLFLKGKKVYQKGFNVGNFVDKLNFDVLFSTLEDDLKDLKSNM